MGNLCRKCNVLLDSTNITKSTMEHGDYICRKCNNVLKKQWCDKNAEKSKLSARLRMRKWRLSPANVAKERSRYADSYPKYSERYKEYSKNLRIKNPEVISARSMVNNYLRAGKIIKKPCEICGKEKVEAHHRDYFKPLEVIWLCSRHHKAIHQKMA